MYYSSHLPVLLTVFSAALILSAGFSCFMGRSNNFYVLFIVFIFYSSYSTVFIFVWLLFGFILLNLGVSIIISAIIGFHCIFLENLFILLIIFIIHCYSSALTMMSLHSYIHYIACILI